MWSCGTYKRGVGSRSAGCLQAAHSSMIDKLEIVVLTVNIKLLARESCYLQVLGPQELVLVKSGDVLRDLASTRGKGRQGWGSWVTKLPAGHTILSGPLVIQYTGPLNSTRDSRSATPPTQHTQWPNSCHTSSSSGVCRPSCPLLPLLGLTALPLLELLPTPAAETSTPQRLERFQPPNSGCKPPTWFLMPSTDPVSSSTLFTTSLSRAIMSWKVAGPPGGWPQQRSFLEV